MWEPDWIERLLKLALRCNIPVIEFWDLTPHEVYLSIDAAIWRDERDQKLSLKSDWMIAALSRIKRLPKLSALLASSTKTRALKGSELRERRAEFKAMTKNLDLQKINQIKAVKK